jgi:hypothetical protein
MCLGARLLSPKSSLAVFLEAGVSDYRLQAQPGETRQEVLQDRELAQVRGWPTATRRRDGSVSADGAYDKVAVYDAVENHKGNRSPRMFIPPKKNAQLKPEVAVLKERNRNIRSRARLGKRQ